MLEKILVIVLCRIKSLERLNFGDDGAGINLGGVELRHIRLSDALLLIVRIENGGAILRTGIRALAIPLRGVVRNGKENHQELAVSDFGRIEIDANGFGVSRDAHADTFVGWRFHEAARIAGRDGLDAFLARRAHEEPSRR